MPVWTRSPLPRRAAALGATLALTAPLALGCDEDKPPSVENNNNSSTANCAVDTLAVTLDDPAPNAGFAPLTVDLQGRISLVEPVNYTWSYDFGDGASRGGVNSNPQTTTVYTAPGEYTVTLRVQDTTCDKAIPPVETTVTVYSPVELEGEELLGRPGNVSIGEEVRVSMRVLNSSESDLQVPVGVRFYLSPNAGVAWEQLPLLTELGEVTLEPEGGVTLSAGGRANIDERFDVPSRLATGTYYIIAAIDPSEHIGEGDDTRNNLVSSETPIFVENNLTDAPDLTVGNVQVGPSTAFQRLSSIVLNADLANIGTGFATDVSYAVYLQLDDEEFDPATAVKVYEPAEAIPVLDFAEPNNSFQIRGQQIVLSSPLELPDGADESQVWAFVVMDPDNAIAEGGIDDEAGLAEQNNVARSLNPIRLSNEPQQGTDVVVIGFDFQPRATFLDGSVQLTLDVGNFGTDPTRSFFCSVFLSEDEGLDPSADIQLANINISNINPGDEPVRIQRTIVVPGFLPVGEFNAFVSCDPSNVISETFEDNNIAALDGPVTITPDAVIDLQVTEIALSSAQVDDGSPLTVNVTVTNTGTNGAGPSKLRLRRSLDATINNQDLLLAEVDVAPLNPGATVTVPIEVSALSCDIFQSMYRLGVVVDATNLVRETNETNNTVVVEETVTIAGDRCDCAEDDYEPNDTPATCAPFTGGVLMGQAICSGGNKDYYCVELAQGESLSVDMAMRHTGAGANLDLRILTPEFQPIPTATSQTDGPTEQADLFLVQQPGRYIIEVGGRAATDVNEYDLTTVITQPGPGVDLSGALFTVSNARPALASQMTAGFTLLNTRNDPSGAFEIKYWLSTDTAVDLTDFDLATVAVDNLDGARSALTEATFTIPVGATAGAYYVCAQIDHASAVTEVVEDNNVVCSPQITVDTSCYDAFEENDTTATATPLSPGTYENLTVCDRGRSDFYAFCVSDGQRFSVSAAFTHAQGDIDLRLRRDDGMTNPELDSSTTIANTETIAVDYVNGDQCYFLEVYHNNTGNRDPDGANAYTLTYTLETADPALRCDSALEPNDTIDLASSAGASLLEAVNEDLTLDRCPQSDVDFYYLDLSAGPSVEICVENDISNAQNYNFTLVLYDPTPRQVAARTGANPCVNYTVSVSGRYYVRVLSTNSTLRAIRYKMSVDGLFGRDLTGANLDLQPSDVIPGESLLAVSFDLRNGRVERAEGVEWGLYYNPTSPIIDPSRDLALYRESVGGVDGFGEIAIRNRIIEVPDVPGFVAGTGYFGVFIDPDNTVEEVDEGNNRLFRSVNLLVCEDDDFAGNTSLDDAADLDLNTTYEELRICAGTRDWYCLGELEAGEYRAQALFDLARDAGGNPILSSDLNLRAYNGATGAPLAADLAVNDNAEVTFTLANPTEICVEVSPFNRTEGANTYDLRVFGPLANLVGVDLTPISITADPELLKPGNMLTVRFSAGNLNADAAASVPYRVFFSLDEAVDAGDALIGSGTLSDLEGFGIQPGELSVAIPDEAAFPDGPGFIIVVLDPDDTIAEADEDNNEATAPVFITRCTDSGFTNNGTLATARTIVLGTSYTGQTICPTAQDWYCVNAPDDGNYRLTTTFELDPEDASGSDLAFTVLRVNAAGEAIDVLAQDTATEGNTTLNFALPSASRVCVQVQGGAPFASNDYDFVLEGPLAVVSPVELRATGLMVSPNQLILGETEGTASFAVSNVGSAEATDVTWALYISRDNLVDDTDTLIGMGSIPSVGGSSSSDVITQTFTPDAGLMAGSAFVLLVVDTAGAFDEDNENNNRAAAPVTLLAPALSVELSVTSLVVTPTDAIAGQTTLGATFTVSNDGDDAAADVAWRLVYSQDDLLDAGDVELIAGVLPSVAAGADEEVSTSALLPNLPEVVDGDGFLIAVVDPADVFAEEDETDNQDEDAIDVSRPVVELPNLAPSALMLSATELTPGVSSVDFSFTLGNTGEAAAADVAWRLVYSQDATLDAGDLTLASGQETSIAAGGEAAVSGTANLGVDPAFADGAGFLFVEVDPGALIDEEDEGDNLTSAGATFRVRPDVTPETFEVDPTDLEPGVSTLTWSAAIRNQGNAALTGLTWRLVYSQDATLDAGDLTLANGVVDIATGEATLIGDMALLPDDPAFVVGAGFLGLLLDPPGAIAELDEDNNTATAAVTITTSACTGPDCCTLDAECETACTDTAVCVDGACQRTYRDGQLCTLTCGATNAQGTCDVDTCVVPPEGTTGGASCDDGQDNDCDGDQDGDDSDCAIPDQVAAAAPVTAPVGLMSEGALVMVTPSLGGEDVTNQAANLYCTASILDRAWTFDDAAALGTDPLLSAVGGPNAATNVQLGVPYSNEDPTAGAVICNGDSLVVGPFAMPASIGANTYTHMIQVTLGNRPAGVSRLGAGEYLVASYRHNATNGDFYPLIAVGDDADEALGTHRFFIPYGGSNHTITLRFDVISASGTFTDACGFVRDLKAYAVPFINPNTSTLTSVDWDAVGGVDRGNVRFNSTAQRTFADLFAADPAAGHQVNYSALADAEGAVGTNQGMEWRTHATGDVTTGQAGFIDLPAVSVYPGFNRANPIYLDFSALLASSELEDNELAHALLSLDDGASFRKIASVLPQQGVSLPAHFGTSYNIFRRTSVVLPEEAKTFLANRIRFTQSALDEDERLYLDTLLHYTFNGNVSDVTVAVGAPADSALGTVPVTVRSARTGDAEVQCFWQLPGGSDAPTVASEPIVVTFE